MHIIKCNCCKIKISLVKKMREIEYNYLRDRFPPFPPAPDPSEPPTVLDGISSPLISSLSLPLSLTPVKKNFNSYLRFYKLKFFFESHWFCL